ncbi:MAG: radical SAM protein, partial [Candidatus Scalindua sp.]|nr:radical SAM protein [Candidatus Scalindua sp.]
MDKYRIDSHKLIYHVPRVNDWLNGETTYPIYMEISPSGACNHRCTYCALDFMEYQQRYLDTNILKERLTEMGELGLKSVMYAGEGEPFLHKNIAEIINHTKKSGIDVSITTNAVLLDKSLADEILTDVEWIKVRINGATKETYAKIHRSRPDDLSTVIRNMKYAVKIRRENGYKCALGMQLLLIPENQHETEPLAELARDIGMDYLVIKPYSQHPLSKTDRYKSIKYSEYTDLADTLKEFNTSEFSVIFRMQTMKKWDDAGR